MSFQSGASASGTDASASVATSTASAAPAPAQAPPLEEDADIDVTDPEEEDAVVDSVLRDAADLSKSFHDEEDSEVLHDDGATELFRAIEDSRWRDALDVLESPTTAFQARVWVRSTGTENTTFNWSLWRRLPIHEACRRQAPAWLMSALLSEYPESATKKTQFDKLPLHCAVESGAAPEVVNLLIVAYWDGIVARDQSGMTPMDILNQSELLAHVDHRVVFDSLTRCHAAYERNQKVFHDEIAIIRKKNKATLAAIQRRHADEISKHTAEQRELNRRIQVLESKIRERDDTVAQRDARIAKFNQEEARWMARIQVLEDTVSQLGLSLNEERHNIVKLNAELDHAHDVIAARDKTIQTLSGDLLNISMVQQTDITASVIEAERSMRAMVSNQIALQKLLIGQSKGLKALLKTRGIRNGSGGGGGSTHTHSSSSSSVTSHSTHAYKNTGRSNSNMVMEEKKMDDLLPQEDHDAANAAVAAAMTALRTPPSSRSSSSGVSVVSSASQA